MADEFVQDSHAILKKGQVVTATVVSVDTQLRRSQLSLKTPVEAASITEDGQTEAIHPLDDTIKFIEDYTPGRLTFAKVLAVKQTQANVALAENLQGRIDVSEVVDSVSSDDELPLKQLQKGSILQVRILGFHDAKTHRYLPLTHRKSNTQTTLELSCKPSHIATNPLPMQILDDIKIGEKYPAYINKFTGEYVWLNISPTIRGRMHILNLTDRVEKLSTLSSSYPIGAGLSVTVLGKTDDGKYLNFSRGKNVIREIKDVSVGSILPGRVSKVLETGLIVQISDNVLGKVGLTDLSDTYSSKTMETYHENSIVRVCVLEVDTLNKRIALSMRATRTLSSSAKQTDREISSISDIKVGEIIRGFVTNVADSGLFVSLARNIVGRVLIRDLSDQFLKDWKSHFKVNQLVKAKVLSIDIEGEKVGLSLKPSIVDGKGAGKGFDEISEGDRIAGVVSRVEDYGLFIKLDGYSLSGLCHRSEVFNFHKFKLI
jgi:rRNA biogenesis protein RRP5